MDQHSEFKQKYHNLYWYNMQLMKNEAKAAASPISSKEHWEWLKKDRSWFERNIIFSDLSRYIFMGYDFILSTFDLFKLTYSDRIILLDKNLTDEEKSKKMIMRQMLHDRLRLNLGRRP